MPQKSLPNTGPMLPGFETCELLERTTCPLAISSAAASPARTSATQASRRGLLASDPGSGASLPESLASYDPATHSFRTFQRSLDGDLAPFSATLPRSGTMRNGIVSRLPPLVPRISGIAFSFWPTPTVPNGGRSPKGGMSPTGMTPDGKKRQVDLQHAVRMVERQMWPTPRASEYKNPRGKTGNRSDANRAKAGWTLSEMVREAERQMWPTPTARDWRSDKASSATHAKNSRPSSEVAAQGQASGALNPQFVEWLMGFPDGWTD